MARRSLSERLGQLNLRGPRIEAPPSPSLSPSPCGEQPLPDADRSGDSGSTPQPTGGGGIRERLARLVERELRHRSLAERTEKVGSALPSAEREEVAGGGDAAEERGDADHGYTVFERLFPGETRWADVSLEHLTCESSQAWSLLVPEAGAGGFSGEDLLFFDTETTGLSGGTGTLPFMLGMGFWQNGAFCVRIMTLTNPAREEAFLDAFQNWLSLHPFRLLVTYNGATFDLPLMDTRFVLARRPNPLRTLDHLDLLRFARLLWKRDNPSCRLSHLGERYLGLSREGDVPGQEIPALYNLCLRTGRFRALERVRDHNALDLVGLAGLLVLALDYLSGRREPPTPGVRLGLGQLLCQRGHGEKGLGHVLRGTEEGNGRHDLWALRRLSEEARLHADWDRARVWGMRAGTAGDWKPIRALAIQLEHRERDVQEALRVVEEVLSCPDAVHESGAWRHRGYRLIRKGAVPLEPWPEGHS